MHLRIKRAMTRPLSMTHCLKTYQLLALFHTLQNKEKVKQKSDGFALAIVFYRFLGVARLNYRVAKTAEKEKMEYYFYKHHTASIASAMCCERDGDLKIHGELFEIIIARRCQNIFIKM